VKIVFLTPGTGSYYCGACMRDNTLARELLRRGHDVTIGPMYLPLMIDGDRLPGLLQTPILFGGINVYLQQKLALFRHTPAIVDRWLNGKGLLRWAARHSHMTTARDHGEMTLQMLRIEASPLQKELEKLFAWLGATARPDVVCLSNALLAGFIPELKRRLGVPVIAFFQGEDTFLDGLPEPFRTECWTAMGERLEGADARLAPSRFYADFIGGRLGAAPGAIEVVPNGIALDGYAAAEPAGEVPAIGYLARMSKDKGLDRLVDAFLVLAGELGDATTRLRIAGAVTAGDEPFIAEQQRKIAAAGLTARVEWAPNLSREAKISFLRSLALFSVPTAYAEAFGLYTIEAMACGVPVVQPDTAAFPELIAATGGGVCVPAGDARALARAWRDLLADGPRRAQLGRAGRLSVEKDFSAGKMAAEFLRVADRFVRVPA
jgi:glycosyltransferase involved in cell wall biosynthesis